MQLVLTDEVAGEAVPGARWSWRAAMSIGDELRITATVKATGRGRVLYRGDIRSLSDKWSPYGVHVLELACTELSGRLGRINPLEQETQGAGETSGDRLHRIADYAGIPSSRRRFDTGVARMQATNLARNLAGEAEVTTASEGGDLYTDVRRGYLLSDSGHGGEPTRSLPTYNSHGRTSTSRPPTEIPDSGFVACPVTPNTRSSLDVLANEVNLARAGGTVQTARDTASISLFGLHTFARSDLMSENDEDVFALANWRVSETGQRLRLIDGIEVDPIGDPNAWEGIISAGETRLSAPSRMGRRRPRERPTNPRTRHLALDNPRPLEGVATGMGSVQLHGRPRLVGRQLGRSVMGGTARPRNGRGRLMAWETEIPDVVAGQPIEAAWGNKIRNQVVHVVATVAALPVVPDGGVAYVEADDKLYLRRVGAWVPAGPGGSGRLRREDRRTNRAK